MFLQLVISHLRSLCEGASGLRKQLKPHQVILRTCGTAHQGRSSFLEQMKRAGPGKEVPVVQCRGRGDIYTKWFKEKGTGFSQYPSENFFLPPFWSLLSLPGKSTQSFNAGASWGSTGSFHCHIRHWPWITPKTQVSITTCTLPIPPAIASSQTLLLNLILYL